ncbi:sulfatase family protein [Flexithrix dorotheae]|uniref:sulfatase family protein n=1 Tax=Flexithrix dorotheae TaxID=70993 RepID=UPI000374554E|nr:sulfatase [Flexithrix dorotheae]
MINHRNTIINILLSWVLIAYSCTTTNEIPVGRMDKNIVLFVADDLGQDLGCYGNNVIQTPNMDAFAADAVLFPNAFATTASCSASRSVILSGLHNHRTGQYGHAHDPFHFRSFDNLKTLPVMLGNAGYRTASVGKFHVAPESLYHFEEYLNEVNGTHVSHRNPVQMAEAAEAFISKESEKPFFLYFCTSDPHRSASLPTANKFGNRPEGYEGVTEVTYSPEDVIVPPFLPDTPECREELANYYQSVSRIDQGIGKLIELLKKAGKYENTLIIITSDHGIAFPGAKTTVYDPGLKSPLLVRNPYGKKRGTTNNAMISWVDFTPTLLDFAGVGAPEEYMMARAIQRGFHGKSFLPILDQKNPKGWNEIYASHTFHETQMYYPMRVVRDRKYKLIWNIAHQLPYPFASDLWASITWQSVFNNGEDAVYGKKSVKDYIDRAEFELYDIGSDPHESNNLAGLPEYQDVLNRYKEKLKAFQENTNDLWASKWSYQ